MAVKSETGESIESESLERYEHIMSEEKLNSMKKAAVLLALFKKNNNSSIYIYEPIYSIFLFDFPASVLERGSY